jgi:raffinose/stachyose/melibiose transport system substrate-binding protein
MRSSSRALAAVALTVVVASGAAACSSGSSSSSTSPSSSTGAASGSSSSVPTATVNVWLVTTAAAGSPSVSDSAELALATAFDQAHPGDHVNIQLVQNDAYKQKIQLAMGAGNEPQIFWTWGGGPLQQDIKAGKVTPLATTAAASSSSSYLSEFLPSSLGAVTVNGKVYGIPIQGTQPVYFFYNKQVFSKAGLSFPTTWAQLLSDVKTFKSKGIIPVSLAGNSTGWTDLMYLEYLADRIGGPSVADALQSNKPGAWSNPAVTEALTDIQQLISAGAFENGFASLQDNGTNDALVYSGKAAMQLMGDWDISSILSEDKSFVSPSTLGMAPFPTVAGGTGNPADLAGNTASYVSISTNATPAQTAVAKEFFATEVASSSYAKAQVAAGEVPVISGASADFSGSGDLASYDTTIYKNVQSAPSFQYSWDQAMTPGVSATMLTNLLNIFALTEKPAQFVSTLNTAAAKDAASS